MKLAPRLTTAALFVFAFLLVATNVYAQSVSGARNAALPEISIVETTLSVTELDDELDDQHVTVNITLSAPAVAGMSFQVTAFEDTATTFTGAGDEADDMPGRRDFQQFVATIVPREGETTHFSAIFSVLSDQVPEDDETFTIRIINAVNATVGNDRATVTIIDNDDVTVSISDVTVTEGSDGGDSTIADFEVTLSKPNPGPLPIEVWAGTKSGGTATYFDDVGYGRTLLTFGPGETTKYYREYVHADLIPEPDETFYVELVDPVHVTILDGEAVGTIIDDDTVMGSVSVSPTSGLITTEAGGAETFEVVLGTAPVADVTIPLSSSDTSEGTVSPASLTFTSANWNTAQTVTVTGVDDAIDDGDIAYSIITGATSSTDAAYSALDVPDVSVTNTDDDVSGVTIAPTMLVTTEGGAQQAYQIALDTAPASGMVSITVAFDPAQLILNGSSVSPLVLNFTSAAPQIVTVDTAPNSDDADRMTLIYHTITASDAPEYAAGTMLADVTVTIGDVPPPPPSPTCDTENFNEQAVIRTGIPDAMRYAINCRVLYHNQHATDWFGGALYSEANLGVAGLLELGVVQAVDIFSPSGMNYFDGGGVFCLRGEGSLIWFAASGVPRHAEIIGSYTVPEFAGFTCATLFEPGTLVLVARNPVQ